MNNQIFAIYDSKVGEFLNPVTLKNEAEAIRGFHSAVNNPNSDFHKYPGHYTLFHVGEFNPEKGQIIPLETGKKEIGSAIEYKDKQI